MTDRGGPVYGIPPEELAELAALHRAGLSWCRANEIELAPRLSRRVADIAAKAAALPALEVATPSATGLRAVTVRDVDEVPLVEMGTVAAAQILGCSRWALNKRLLRGTLPGRRDARGHWRVELPKGA